jgi:hypothetical protein
MQLLQLVLGAFVYPIRNSLSLFYVTSFPFQPLAQCHLTLLVLLCYDGDAICLAITQQAQAKQSKLVHVDLRMAVSSHLLHLG